MSTDQKVWKKLLEALGFEEKEVGKQASQWIMEKDSFGVEFSTSHLWENEYKSQHSIDDFDDLVSRYEAKTDKKLRINDHRMSIRNKFHNLIELYKKYK